MYAYIYVIQIFPHGPKKIRMAKLFTQPAVMMVVTNIKYGEEGEEKGSRSGVLFKLQSLISFACICFIVSSSFSQVLQSCIGSELFSALANVNMVSDM